MTRHRETKIKPAPKFVNFSFNLHILKAIRQIEGWQHCLLAAPLYNHLNLFQPVI